MLQCQQSFQTIGDDCPWDYAKETGIYVEQRSVLQQNEVIHTAVSSLGGFLSIQRRGIVCSGLHIHFLGKFQSAYFSFFLIIKSVHFQTVSAATSYLIVLLQFDMTAILRNEGLMS